MNLGDHSVELIVMVAYLLLMVAVGQAFRRFNSNISDYFRSGARGTWWLVGSSVLISATSAWTFTGGAAMAYKHGWSIILSNYWTGLIGFLLCALIFAPWFRQIRAITSPECIGMRFDELTRQIYSYKGVISNVFISATHLLAVATIGAAVFDVPLRLLIVVIGLVVVLYATLGGKYAVMATDFLQTMIIIPAGILVSLLCLAKFGGIGGLFEAIDTAGLAHEFRMIKDAGELPDGSFSLVSIGAFFILFGILNNVSMSSAGRYFSVKDGREARYAALLAFVLGLGVSLVWFIPPITARLLYADEVSAGFLQNPSEAAYAVAAFNVLPTGLSGLIIVAIFAATMSSMDSSINGNAGIVVRDILPAIRRGLGKPEPTEKQELLTSRLASLTFGGIVIGASLFYTTLREMNLFQIMMTVLAVVGLPLQVPMLWALFLRRVPGWSALFAGGVATVFAVLSLFSEELFGDPWQTHERVYILFAAGSIAFFLTMPFWKYSSSAYKAKVTAFFKRMHTPVDFEKEVGGSTDLSQLILVGAFGMVVAGLVLLLTLIPKPLNEQLIIVFFSTALFLLGFTLFLAGRRGTRRQTAASSR